MQSRKRRQFSREFKEEAVRLVTEGGQSMAQVARDLDVRPNLLRRWKKELAGESRPEGASAIDEAEELRQLRKENARLRMEREILKKAGGDLFGVPAMRFRFIAEHQPGLPGARNVPGTEGFAQRLLRLAFAPSRSRRSREDRRSKGSDSRHSSAKPKAATVLHGSITNWSSRERPVWSAPGSPTDAGGGSPRGAVVAVTG